MALVAFYLILLVIGSLAIATGGRFERNVAGLMILGSLLGTTSQRLLHSFYPLVPLAVIDAALLTALGWILWRYHRPWIVAITALQVLVVGFDLAQVAIDLLPSKTYASTMSLLAYAQLLALAAGVLWRTYGPPAEPPDTIEPKQTQH